MTIEAGVLSLKITETGADAVLAKLGQIDAKARALGNATQGSLFNTPSATGVNGQLGQMSLNLTKVGQAATAATPAVNAHNAATEKAAKNSASLATQLGSQIVGYYGINQAVNAAVKIFDEFNAASDRQEIAQRKLSATSRLTGVSFGQINAIAGDAQKKFALSSGAAADLTQGFVKLASRAGDVAQTGPLMAAWMDLAKAQGLSLSDVLTGLNTTLVGQDEGLNRLGLMNPSNIWKQWADAAGITVKQMTEQQRWLAIINAVMADGLKVQGEYQKYLESTAGKQEQWNSTLERTAAHIGAAGSATRGWAYEIGTTLLNAFINADKWIDRVAAKSSNWFRSLLGMGPSPLALSLQEAGAETIKGTSTLSPEQLKAQLDLAARVKGPAAAVDKAAAKRAQERLEKALGLDLDQMPLRDLIDTKPQKVAPDPTVGVDKDGKMKGVGKLAKTVDKDFDLLAAKIEERRLQLSGIVMGVGNTIGDAMAAGFTAAFSGGNFFAEMGKALLAVIGNMIVQLGSAMLTYGLLMAVGLPLLMATPFAASAMSAPAAIAAGTGLIALGAGMGALAGGGSKGGGGGGGGGGGSTARPEQDEFAVAFDPDSKLRKRTGGAVVPASRGLGSGPMPEGRPPIVFAPTIIGQDDLGASKKLAYMVERVVMNGGAKGLRGTR